MLIIIYRESREFCELSNDDLTEEEFQETAKNMFEMVSPLDQPDKEEETEEGETP